VRDALRELITVEQVEKAIRAGVDHLYAIQAGDNWDNNWNQDNSNTGGRTALVVYSLLAAGESPQNPKLKSGIDFLLKQKPLGIYTLVVLMSQNAEKDYAKIAPAA